MAAIDLLKQQHRDTEHLFERLKTSQPNEKIRLLGQLTEALTMHATLEEQFIYPLLRANGFEEHFTRSSNEHMQMKRLISDILSMKRRDPRLDSVTAQLEAAVMKHVQEEETEVFPKLQERVDEATLENAGVQMEATMKRLEEGDLLEAADEQQPPAV